MSAEERTIDFGGRTLRYLAAGEGSPLVLLHGAGDSSLAWSWVPPELADGYRVYAPTLPGIGDGTRFTDRSSTAYASLVTGFMEALGIERAALIGNSLGGLIGLRLSLSDPACLGALGLVSIAPGSGAGSIPHSTRSTYPASARRPYPGGERRSALRAHIHHGGQHEVLVDRLHRLQIPTLVLWGARDRVLPAYQAGNAVARLPRGQLEIIPECGHLPHIECPGDFVGSGERFLKENHVVDKPDRKERR